MDTVITAPATFNFITSSIRHPHSLLGGNFKQSRHSDACFLWRVRKGLWSGPVHSIYYMAGQYSQTSPHLKQTCTSDENNPSPSAASPQTIVASNISLLEEWKWVSCKIISTILTENMWLFCIIGWLLPSVKHPTCRERALVQLHLRDQKVIFLALFQGQSHL